MPATPTISPRAGARLAAVLAALLAVGCATARSATHASAQTTVARYTVAPGCDLPTDPDLQPYECGGDYAGTFNEAIPAGTPTDPSSSELVSEMVQSMRRTRVSLDESTGVPSVWIASPSDPTWQVTSSMGEPTISFQMPPQAVPAAGSDAPLLVYDPSNSQYGPDTELRAWQARVDAADHTISTTEYGLFHYGRDSDGQPFAGVGTGYGLSWAGLIRPWEVQSGSIDHALRMAAPVDSSAFRLPAIRSDCTQTALNDCEGIVAEGMRLQLSPSVNCAKRTVPFSDPGGRDTRLLREICRALQVYGVIITDGSGDPNLYTLFMEDGTEVGGDADWDTILNRPPGGLWGNIIRDINADYTGDGIHRNATTGIPWGDMRLLSRSVF